MVNNSRHGRRCTRKPFAPRRTSCPLTLGKPPPPPPPALSAPPRTHSTDQHTPRGTIGDWILTLAQS
eukprot:7068203-Pyramimonas_sp.AAC.2